MPLPDPNPQRTGHAVRVVSCHGVMVRGVSGYQRMAVLTFSRGRQLLEPYCLNTMQVHVLIRDLIQVLHSLEPGIDGDSGIATVDPLRSPPIPAAPLAKAKTGKVLRPSRNPSSPTGPIQATESWQLHSILKNVKNHDDFLKFISAEAVADDSTEAARLKNTAPSPISSIAVTKGRKRLNRSTTQKKGKKNEGT